MAPAKELPNNSGHGNLLFLSRANWTVDGNLIAVSAGNTEASLEMEGASSSNKANLTVNGSLMMFAEATGQEAEIDIESNPLVREKEVNSPPGFGR